MSRIGKKPIVIPDKVTVSVSPENVVTIKGPKGELSQQVNPAITVEVVDKAIVLKRPDESKQMRAYHGLYRALLNNMVIGVTEGYKKEMELVGVGYRATVSGNVIEFALGYSHPIFFVLPPEVKATTTAEKGKNPTIILESIDKQLLGHVAAKIRSFRKPEPYKGKGIRFVDEQVRRKAGKAAAKK
jgi:large subunit ribosomal protein L6